MASTQTQDGLLKPEVQEFLEEKNSADGCVKYHDVYVRAVGHNDENFRIYLTNVAEEVYCPRFEIYRKLQSYLYSKASFESVRDIIIYIKDNSDEKQRK